MILTTGCGGGGRGYLDVHGLPAAQGQVGAGRDAGPRVLGAGPRPPRGQDAGHGWHGHRAIGVTPHYRGSLPRSRGLRASRGASLVVGALSWRSWYTGMQGVAAGRRRAPPRRGKPVGRRSGETAAVEMAAVEMAAAVAADHEQGLERRRGAPHVGLSATVSLFLRAKTARGGSVVLAVGVGVLGEG